jgi:hypothetical protein
MRRTNERIVVKTIVNCFAIGLAGSLSVGAFSARADLEVSASVSIRAEADFYAPLTPHGGWIEVNSYGRCWRPAEVAVGWRPYCSGHWIWTDCGWYWASDEPWAWACYHYGSWVYDPVYFWVWVPGVEWGPAWVSWRVGGGYIGWAPLPPPRLSVAVAAPHFVFVEVNRFSDPVRPSTVVVNNTTIINKTTVINNVRRETRDLGGAGRQKVVINEGPGVDLVQKGTGKTVRPVPIDEAARQTPAPRTLLSPTGEPRNKTQPSGPAEQAGSKPRREVTPNESRGQPPEPPAPNLDKHNARKKEQIDPSPNRPPAGPPGRPSQPPKPSDPGKGHEKEGDGQGKDKPKRDG